MAIITIVGSKGGVGTSLVATNIASSLAGQASVVLIDVHSGTGVDDLLLDVGLDKSWDQLLPVLDEVLPKHVELATSVHTSGLKLICGPDSWARAGTPDELAKLSLALADFFDFSVVDLPAGLSALNRALLAVSDVTLLVTTADPPALRCAKRFIAELTPETSARVGLVINQINRQHPSTAGNIADSLATPLLAALPPDPRAVGYQIHFGTACVQDNSSPFGRGVRGLTSRLNQSARSATGSVHLMQGAGDSR
jgi:pilus assembly protein CpaE